MSYGATTEFMIISGFPAICNKTKKKKKKKAWYYLKMLFSTVFIPRLVWEKVF